MRQGPAAPLLLLLLRPLLGLRTAEQAAAQRLGFFCFSCASTSYLPVWNRHLLGHYFPPKNFTEQCWRPTADVGVQACSSACFTIVEEIFGHSNQEAVMRGCMDRLLLFGLDQDIKTAISGLGARSCRTIDRHLLNLVSLNDNVPLVLLCSCVGKLCNSDEVHNNSARSGPSAYLYSLLSLLLGFL